MDMKDELCQMFAEGAPVGFAVEEDVLGEISQLHRMRTLFASYHRERSDSLKRVLEGVNKPWSGSFADVCGDVLNEMAV